LGRSELDIRIGTERLLLRDLLSGDVTQDYADWLNDRRVNRFLVNSLEHNTIDSCLTYVRSYAGRSDRALIGLFDRSTNLHIGNLTLSAIDRENECAVVGISIGREGCRGRGYATEAMTAMRDYCFETLQLRRLEAHLLENNYPSLRLFIRSGFRVEGLRRAAAKLEGKRHAVYVMGVVATDELGEHGLEGTK